MPPNSVFALVCVRARASIEHRRSWSREEISALDSEL